MNYTGLIVLCLHKYRAEGAEFSLTPDTHSTLPVITPYISVTYAVLRESSNTMIL